MKKLALIIIVLFVNISITISQNLDTRTKNQIHAKYLTAEGYCNNGDYSKALGKISEIEALLNGNILATSQSLKVRALIGEKQYEKADKELYILQGMSLSDKIMKETAIYTRKIDEGRERQKRILAAEKIANREKVIKNYSYRTLYYIYKIKNPGQRDFIAIKDKKYKKKYADDEYSKSKYELINENGIINTFYKYDEIDYIPEDGLALVMKYDFSNLYRGRPGIRFGYINKYGKEVIPLKYTSAESFSNGYANVSKTKYSEYNQEILFNGFINTKGKKVLDYKKYSSYKFYDLVSSNGLLQYKHNGKFGLCDINMNIVIPAKFDMIGFFDEGLAWVKKNGQYATIDRKGNIVNYYGVYDNLPYRFSNGLAIVKQNNKYGVVNNKGKQVVPFNYSNSYALKIFKNGNIRVRAKGIYKLFNNNGKLISSNNKSIYTTTTNQIILKVNDTSYKLLDVNNNIIASYNKIDNYSSENRRIVKSIQSFGYINSSGQEVIKCIYDEVQYFKENIASVKKNGKFGCIDLNGNVIIPFKFDAIGYFFEGMAVAKLNGKEIIINKQGEVIY